MPSAILTQTHVKQRSRVDICFTRYVMQWIDGPDGCDDNWVHGNVIETCGNECIEVKEGSSGNLIEENDCSNQRDPKAGCYGSRGDRNTIRFEILKAKEWSPDTLVPQQQGSEIRS